MMRRCLLGVAIAILIAGSVTFAQDQGQGSKDSEKVGIRPRERPGLDRWPVRTGTSSS